MYKVLLLGLLAAVPTSTNFTLKTYDFGNGADSSSSSSYNLQASTGSPNDALTSSSYALPAGIRASASAATPLAPTFANPDNSYNRLKLTLNTTDMPSDAKYLIAISDDNFVTTNYVQTDQTVGPTAGIGNYQSYAAWGGASGCWVLGLNYSTTYKVKIAALQGPATGSAFGPSATAATVAPSVTFAVSTSATSTPPFSVGFGSLTPGTVISGDATIIVDITTNALSGGSVLIKSQNAGLSSVTASTTITSQTADLSGTNSGYGAQLSSTSQTSGGPVTASSPFDGSAANVGGLAVGWQQLVSFNGGVVGGNLITALKAKAAANLSAATDYGDVLSLAVSLNF